MTTMRPVLFVACFSLGITLMLYSSVNQPRTAQATLGWMEPAIEEILTPDDLKLRIPRARRVTPAPSLDARERIRAAEAVEQTFNPDAGTADDGDAVAAAHDAAQDAPDAETAQDAAEDAKFAVEDDGEPTADGAAADELADADADPIDFAVDAGADRVVWAALGEVLLSATGPESDETSYSWQQTAGPRLPLESLGPDALVGGLDSITAWTDVPYEFAVTATGPDGSSAVDQVTIVARWAPPLEIIPSDEANAWTDRYFDEVDGAPLAHYETWLLAQNDVAAGFVIDSAERLKIDRIEDGPFEMSYSAENGRHLYQFDVYQQGEESRSRLLLFVETAERVPAVIQLGVEW